MPNPEACFGKMPSKKITKRPSPKARAKARTVAAAAALSPPGPKRIGLEDLPDATPWGLVRTKANVRDFRHDYLVVGCAMKTHDGLVIIWCSAWEEDGEWRVGKVREPEKKPTNIQYLEHKELSDAGSVRIVDGNPPWAAALPQPLWVR